MMLFAQNQIMDFRLESLQQMLTGKIMPGERRMMLMEKRREAFTGDLSSTDTLTTNQEQRQDENFIDQEESSETDKWASRTGTASRSDIEGAAPKTGANRPDNAEPVGADTEVKQSTSTTGPPSMSEAANIVRSDKGIIDE